VSGRVATYEGDLSDASSGDDGPTTSVTGVASTASGPQPASITITATAPGSSRAHQASAQLVGPTS